jgi:hypothetical protein
MPCFHRNRPSGGPDSASGTASKQTQRTTFSAVRRIDSPRFEALQERRKRAVHVRGGSMGPPSTPMASAQTSEILIRRSGRGTLHGASGWPEHVDGGQVSAGGRVAAVTRPG